MIDDNSDGYYPQTAARQRPIGLRLEQTLKNGSTPSRTVFGRGVSFMEGQVKWHYLPMNDDEYRAAVAEVER